MRSYFNDKDRANKKYDFTKELEDFAREIRDTPGHPDRYTAEMILLSRQSQKIHKGLCEMAIAGELSEEQMETICKYFEDELAKIEEFVERI